VDDKDEETTTDVSTNVPETTTTTTDDLLLYCDKNWNELHSCCVDCCQCKAIGYTPENYGILLLLPVLILIIYYYYYHWKTFDANWEQLTPAKNKRRLLPFCSWDRRMRPGRIDDPVCVGRGIYSDQIMKQLPMKEQQSPSRYGHHHHFISSSICGSNNTC